MAASAKIETMQSFNLGMGNKYSKVLLPNKGGQTGLNATESEGGEGVDEKHKTIKMIKYVRKERGAEEGW